MKSSKKEAGKEWEESLKAAGEREWAELKLPESLRPENIKKKILEYEAAAQEKESSSAKSAGENGSLPEQKRQSCPKTGEEKEAGGTGWSEARKPVGRNGLVRRAGVILSAAAAVCVIAAGLRFGTPEWFGSKKSADRTEANQEAGGNTEDTSDPESDYSVETDGSSEESAAISDQAADQETVQETVRMDGIRQADSYAELRRICEESGLILREEASPEEKAAADMDKGSDSSNDYSVTNIQVGGVDEGDVVKTDGTYIYRLSNVEAAVLIYRTADGEVSEAGKIRLSASDEEEGIDRSYSDLFLQDGYLAVIGTMQESGRETRSGRNNTPDGFPPAGKQRTELAVYDVSRPEKAVLLGSRIQDGSYFDARMVDSYLYLFTEKRNGNVSEDEDLDAWVARQVPEVDGETIACSSIYLPEQPDTADYVVMTATDIRHPGEAVSSAAALGRADQLYVSKKNIYLWQSGWEESGEEAFTVTTIMKYTYGAGQLRPAAVQTVEGQPNNSFSMDEADGFLRLVTTKESPLRSGDGLARETLLYVLDEKMNVLGKLGNLAEGESVKSVRFLGNMVYFVTFLQTDPLFCVDLSDPYRPEVKGELKVSGFSEYLHPFGDGLLLGVGQEADEGNGRAEGLKLSMFDVSDPEDVKEIARRTVREGREYARSDVEYDHRALLVSAEKNMIGFSVTSGRGGSGEDGDPTRNLVYEYCLFRYENGGFTEWITHDFGSWENLRDSRGVYIGDYLYLVSGNGRVAVYNWRDGNGLGVFEYRFYQ